MSDAPAKRGKPAADPDNVREHRVQCMVSESEMKQLKDAATKRNVTLSKLLYGPVRAFLRRLKTGKPQDTQPM